jgi:hypothetical protein
MRKFLGTLVLVALIIAGIGFYRGWFSVSKDDQPGETNVELRIDKERVRDDAEEVSRKARQLGGEVEEHIDDGKESRTQEDTSQE